MPSVFMRVHLDDIHLAGNMRKTGLDGESVRELLGSIRVRGLLEPIVISRSPEGSEHPYRLVSGYRRILAIRLLRKEDMERFSELFSDGIPSILLEDESSPEDDIDIMKLQLTENLQRVDPSLSETILAIRSLVKLGVPDEDISVCIGRPLHRTIALREMSETLFSGALTLIDKGILGVEAAFRLSKLDLQEQKEIVEFALSKWVNEGVASARSVVQDELFDLDEDEGPKEEPQVEGGVEEVEAPSTPREDVSLESWGPPKLDRSVVRDIRVALKDRRDEIVDECLEILDGPDWVDAFDFDVRFEVGFLAGVEYAIGMRGPMKVMSS